MDKREQFEEVLASMEMPELLARMDWKQFGFNCWQAAQAAPGEAVATLHDDGHWTLKPHMNGSELAYKSSFAGWRMDVYAAPPAAQPEPGAVEWSAERLARLFHDRYEALAPLYGWQTQKISAVRFDELPQSNKRLMMHVCREVLYELRKQEGAVEWNAAIEAAAKWHDERQQYHNDMRGVAASPSSQGWHAEEAGRHADFARSIRALKKARS